MMNNAWKLVEPPEFANKPAWSGSYSATGAPASPQKSIQQYQHSKFPAPVSTTH